MQADHGEKALLLTLSDAFRTLTDPAEIEGEGTRILGEWAGATWAYYLEIDEAERTATILEDYTLGDVPSMVGQHRLDDLGGLLDKITLGQPFAEDFLHTDIVSERARAQYMGIGMRSFLCAPVVRAGRVQAALTLAATDARDWDRIAEVMTDAAERTWEAIARARGEASLSDAFARLAASHHRQQLLTAELQHRVRNILAMVRSVVRRTGETARSAEEFRDHLIGRLDSLARTQAVLTRSAGAGVELELLVREELLSQAAEEDRISVSGEPVTLAPKAAEVVTLAIHELATNSTKYGALSWPKGAVEVGWERVEEDGQPWLHLRWRETGVPVIGMAPRRSGFGTELITRRVPHELGGRGTLDFRPGVVEATLAFPLRHATSILQTDSPDVAEPPR